MPELTIVNGYKLSTDGVFQIRPEFYVHQIRITPKASIANILITGNIALKFSTILELLQLSKAKFSVSTEDFRQTSRLLIRFVYSKEEWNFHMKDLSVTCCGPTLKTSRLGRFLQEAPDGCSDLRLQMNSATSTTSN